MRFWPLTAHRAIAFCAAAGAVLAVKSILFCRRRGEVVFVEVKSSRSFAQAVAHLTRHQIGRLLASAEAALGFFGAGSLTPMRFDVALVDGMGRIDVIPNALKAG